MKNRFTTITIASNDNRETKFITIDTKHVDNFKKYSVIAVSSLSLIILITLTLFISLLISKNEIKNLNGNILSLKSDLKLLDSLEIKRKVNDINNNIDKINKYLFERGIFKSENSGGPENSSNEDIRIYDYYLTKTNAILSVMRNVPIGNPHIGEFKSYFGYRSNPFSGRGSEFHKGLDIKGNIGDTVRCTADGTIEKAEYDGGYGKVIRINHQNGLVTIFGHLSGWNVKQGDVVKAGDVIGFVGSTGRSTGPHLHYEIRFNDENVNPQNFLNIKN